MARAIGGSMLLLSLAIAGPASCALESRACIERVPTPPSSREGGSPFGLLRCDVVPELCDRPVESEIVEPDYAIAIDLVFVSDGFDDDVDAFHDRVDELVEGARSDPVGILGRDPRLFNIHRVEVTAELGTCTVDDEASGTEMLSSDLDRVLRAAANAPDVDAVIVVSNGIAGRANSPDNAVVPIINLGAFDDRTLTHELGHGLFALTDEYVELAEVYPYAGRVRSFSRIRPNATLDPDEAWDGLVDGAPEGAMRYARGVHRPTDSCRMGNSDSDLAFCPVCSAHIDATLAARRAPGTRAPICGFLYSPANEVGEACSLDEPGCGAGGRALLHVIAWDPDGITDLRIVADDLDLPLSICNAPGPCEPILVEQQLDMSTEGVARLEARCTDAAGDVGGSGLDL